MTKSDKKVGGQRKSFKSEMRRLEKSQNKYLAHEYEMRRHLLFMKYRFSGIKAIHRMITKEGCAAETYSYFKSKRFSDLMRRLRSLSSELKKDIETEAEKFGFDFCHHSIFCYMRYYVYLDVDPCNDMALRAVFVTFDGVVLHNLRHEECSANNFFDLAVRLESAIISISRAELCERQFIRSNEDLNNPFDSDCMTLKVIKSIQDYVEIGYENGSDESYRIQIQEDKRMKSHLIAREASLVGFAMDSWRIFIYRGLRIYVHYDYKKPHLLTSNILNIPGNRDHRIRVHCSNSWSALATLLDDTIEACALEMRMKITL